MYRDDLAATHARVEQLQRELSTATAQQTHDKQRIAQLTAQIASLQQALHAGAQPRAMIRMQAPHYVFGSRSTAVLTLGILSLVVCSVIGPIAWSMGNEEMRRMDAGQTPDDQRGAVVAGRICGIIASVFLMFFGFFVLMIIATAGH
jgi:hypothetical protein